MHQRCLYLLLFMLTGCQQTVQDPESFQVTDVLGGPSEPGFARATEIRRFSFPEDHGPHPAYRNEWWYITGNVTAEKGRDFGFQVTFFRVALQPDMPVNSSSWRSNQIWMAHVALTDITAGNHLALERFARQAVGLAGAQASPTRVWLEDWSLAVDAGSRLWHLQIPADDFILSLELQPISPLILQGDRGLSQKSSLVGNASYYYSIPRLRVSGHITTQGEVNSVDGLAWLDREWSSSALGPEQVGWDWFSLQLHDNRNLMYYQLRRRDGGIDPHSNGSLSDGQGLLQHLYPDDVQLTPLTYWHVDNRSYPIEWRLHLKDEASPWIVRALLADQEMPLSVRYWEGAVEVSDEQSGKVLGRGYLEMAGYDRLIATDH